MFKIISFASMYTIIFIVLLNIFKILTDGGNRDERQNKSSLKRNKKNKIRINENNLRNYFLYIRYIFKFTVIFYCNTYKSSDP